MDPCGQKEFSFFFQEEKKNALSKCNWHIILLNRCKFPLTIIINLYVFFFSHLLSPFFVLFFFSFPFFLLLKQSVPVAASTISLLMLSLDRLFTVKHPKLAQLRQRRSLPSFLAFASWISAICVSVPILFENGFNFETMVNSTRTNQTQQELANILLSENVTKSSTITTNPVLSEPNNSNGTIHMAKTLCQLNFSTMQMPSVFLMIYTFLVFILPGIGVILNHLGVHHKLCALSLTARAAHGELPLPMPIMRRPTHMIIVTGMANAE